MKNRFLIILSFLLMTAGASLSAQEKDSALESFFTENETVKGVDYMSMEGGMLKLAKRMIGSKSPAAILMNNTEKLYIFDMKRVSEQDREMLYREASEDLDHYVLVKTFTEDGTENTMYMSTPCENDDIYEFIIITKGKENTIIAMTGNYSKEMMTRMAELD